MSDNSFSTSDELGFWSQAMAKRGRPLGYMPLPEPEPAPAPTGPTAEQLAAMSYEEFSAYRASLGLGLGDDAEFLGKVERWKRPVADAQPFIPAKSEMQEYTEQRATLGMRNTSSVLGASGYVPPAGRLPASVRPDRKPTYVR